MDNNARSTSVLKATSKRFIPKHVTRFRISNEASHNLCGNKDLFDKESFLRVNGTLNVANLSVMAIKGCGCIDTWGFSIPDVLYVPGLQDNVVSVEALVDMDYSVLLHKEGLVKEWLGDEVVGKATLVNGRYMVDYLHIPLGRSCLPNNDIVEAAIRIWQ